MCYAKILPIPTRHDKTKCQNRRYEKRGEEKMLGREEQGSNKVATRNEQTKREKRRRKEKRL